MQLTQNRYFKHKYFNSVIKSEMRKGLAPSTNPDAPEMHHLYIDLIEGDKIFGMDGNSSFMLKTAFHTDTWTEDLEEWTKDNQYVDYNPFLMNQEDASKFLFSCYQDKPTLRLGQAIINRLGDKTPTPNIDIFNSVDEDYVLAWFYKNCVKED